jgi:hypothetical protein
MQLPRLLKKIVGVLLMLPLTATAQDITGLWKGTLYNDTTRETLRFEVGISEEKGKMTGFSHTFIQHEDRLYFAIKKIKVKRKGDKIIIEDIGILFNSSPLLPPKGVNKTCVLDLDTPDSLMVLSGPFITNRTREYHALTGRVHLQRKNDYYQSDLLARLAELKLTNEKEFAPMAYLSKAPAPEASLASNRFAPSATEVNLPAINGAVSPTSLPTTAKATPAAGIAGNKAVAVDNYPVPVTDAELTLDKQPRTAAAPVASNNSNKPAATIAVAANKAVAVDNYPLPVTEADLTLAKQQGTAVQPTAMATNNNTPSAHIVSGKTVPVKLDKPVMSMPSGPASEVNGRNIETAETVWVEADSLQLTLYDNGEVDGDTVSVLMNGKVILPMQGLSTKAVKKTIFLPPGTDSLQLVMYAESLGSIPPNTGLLVVHDGEKVYEIRFSADMKKNAGVLFRRKK